MIVVSNTSPIINLAAIGQLALLQHIYGKIIVPKAVYREIIIGVGQPGAMEIQTLAWFESRAVIDSPLVRMLKMELDEGEAEAIALAVELKTDLLLLDETDLLLLDERKGREIASRLNLNFIGLLGVLMEAKHKGHIRQVKPILDELMTKAGFWVSEGLYRRFLQTTGE